MPLSEKTRLRLRESAFVILVPIALYLLFALWSYNPADPSWSHAASGKGAVGNLGGKAGAYLSDLLFYLFGYVAYLAPFGLLFLSWRIFDKSTPTEEQGAHEPMVRVSGLLILVLSGCLLLALRGGGAHLPAQAGGVLGGLLAKLFQPALGVGPASMFTLACTLVGITLATGLSWFRAMDWIGAKVLSLGALMQARLARRAPVPGRSGSPRP